MPTTAPRVRALTDEFIADLSLAIHEAALEAVREALDGVPGPGGPRRDRRKATRKKAANGRRKKGSRKKAAKKTTTKATRRVKRVRRSAGDVEATASAILTHVRANPGSSVGDVGKGLGLTTKDLALPIKKLVAEKRLRTEGERRGTRYFAGGRRDRSRAKRSSGGTQKKSAKKPLTGTPTTTTGCEMQGLPSLAAKLAGRVPALTVAFLENGLPKCLVATGFLVQERGMMFWVTAGHVLDLVEELIEAHRVVSCRFQDGYRGSIPIELDGWPQARVDDAGLDYGVVPLTPNQTDVLQSNPSFDAWSFSSFLDAERRDVYTRMGATGYSCSVIGYPTEWVSYRRIPGGISISARAVEIPFVREVSRSDIESGSSPPAHDFWFDECQYAQIPAPEHSADDPLSSIRGVSGGPVVLWKEGEFMLAGIQTAWHPPSRVVRWLPIDYLKNFLDQFFRFRESQSRTRG